MAIDFDFNDVWNQAKEQYTASLKPKELEILTSISSKGELLVETRNLQTRYRERRASRSLERIYPFLAGIESFSEVINAFVSSDPKIAAIVWGSLCFIFKLAIRHADNLERVIGAFESFDRALPRFHYYIAKFGSRTLSDRLKTSLVKYYAELIGICQDSIKFLKNSTLYNFFIGAFRTYTSQAAKRVSNLRDITTWVDTEAIVAADDARQAERNAQHRELLEKLIATAMRAGPHDFQNLPCIQNVAFFGRDSAMQQLKFHLKPGNRPEDLLSCALYGLGGAGKTQIAIEYAYRHINDYAAICWVTAETQQKIAESFAALARSMKVVDEGLQQLDQIRELFKSFLISSSKGDPPKLVNWLMIFDNVEDAATLTPYWPNGARGSVIITTRDPNLARRYVRAQARIEVCPFSDKEGEAFLLSLVHHDGSDTRKFPNGERSTALHISKTLGNLPLAIHLVGSYVSSTGMTLSRFVETNKDFEREFIFNEAPHHWDAQEYQQSINTTWTLKLQSTTDSARLLMDILAFLDADGVPSILFGKKAASDLLTGGPDLELPGIEAYMSRPFEGPGKLDESIGSLLKGSLISRSPEDDQISCHRLVQIAVTNAMTTIRKREVFTHAMFLLNATFPRQENGKPLHSQWRSCQLLCRHVAALLSTYHWLKADLDFPILLCEIITRCSWFLHENGRFRAAKAMAEAASLICEEAMAAGVHPGFSDHYIQYLTTHLYNVQACVDTYTQAPGSGLSLYYKIMDIRKANQRPGSVDDAMWLSYGEQNLGIALMAEDRAEEALPIYLTREHIQENRDFNLANITICLYLLKRYDEATTYCYRAIDATRELRGENSASMATPIFYLGNIHYTLGNLNGAFEAFSKCLAIRRDTMPHHHHTGLTLYKLGVVVRQRGDLESSIVFFRESLWIIQNSEYHPGASCRSAFALSEVFAQLGRFSEADSSIEEGRKLREQIPDVEQLGLGTSPEEYDKFVGFSHR